MNTPKKHVLRLTGMLVAVCVPAFATVKIVSITPSGPSPQPLGTPITFTVTATDSNPGPLTFQFNIAYGSGAYSMSRDFNVGTLSGGTWTSQPFLWTPTGAEGSRKIQVVIKDFASGETQTKAIQFVATPLSKNGNPVVNP